MRFLIRWLINAVALYAAIYLLRGVIQPQSSSWLSLIWLALILVLVLLIALLRSEARYRTLLERLAQNSSPITHNE